MQIDTEQLQNVEITDAYITELLNALVSLFNLFIAQEENKRAELQLELEALKQSLDGYVSPDYGMLPVPAPIYEQVVDIAQARSVSPGVLMTSPRVLEYLRQMIEREIL